MVATFNDQNRHHSRLDGWLAQSPAVRGILSGENRE
jgi:hypothetical protein